MTCIGVVFPAHAPPPKALDFARNAEALGYDELWVVEDCFLSGGLTLATAALAATTTLKVGVGLLPAAVRNPAIVAMEISTLSRMFPGRVTVAFGHGVDAWMTQIGARPSNRLRALEEVVTATRRLLAGDTVSVDGSFVSLTGVALDEPPDVPPAVLVGTTGPRGIALAARDADGLLLPEGAGPAFIAAVRSITSAATPAVSPEIAVYTWLRIGEDEAARAEIRDSVAQWASSGLYPGLVGAARVDGALPAGPVPRDLADELGAFGAPDQCAEAVLRLCAAGAHRIALIAVGSDFEDQYATFARAALPAVRARQQLAAADE